jgi:hypothetical protein
LRCHAGHGGETPLPDLWGAWRMVRSDTDTPEMHADVSMRLRPKHPSACTFQRLKMLLRGALRHSLALLVILQGATGRYSSTNTTAAIAHGRTLLSPNRRNGYQTCRLLLSVEREGFRSLDRYNILCSDAHIAIRSSRAGNWFCILMHMSS